MDKILTYIEEAVQCELNASSLYKLFSEYFTKDYNLWWQLSIEELDHASLLRSTFEFYKVSNLPFDISDTDLKVLISLNNGFPSIVEEFKKNTSIRYAFEIALNLENSVGEIHYQKFMTNENKDDELSLILKRLNKDDINHELRIKQYMIENNI